MTHTARGDGPIPSRIMLVGEAWGSEEERTHLPFQGASGQLLNQLLHEAGIMRSECYATNVVNARPPRNDIEVWVTKKRKDIQPTMMRLRDFWVEPVVLAGWHKFLAELHEVQPNIVVALGNTAMWALTGLTGITKWRGSQLNASIPRELYPPGILAADETPWSGKVISTVHPSAVLRDPSQRQLAILDLKRAAKERTSNVYTNVPEWRFTVRPTFGAATETLARLLAQVESGVLEWLDFDIETAAGHIECVGISWSLTDAIILPLMCRENRTGYWTEAEEAEIVYALYLLLTHPRAKVRWQNGLYDAQYTYRWWHFVPRGAQDTMISHHSAFCGLPKSLAFQASMYCDHYVYWKDDGKVADMAVPEDERWRYNGTDCVRTREVGEASAATIKTLGLGAVDAFQQKFFWPVLQCMQRGIAIDKKVRAKFAEELLEEMSKREAFFAEVLDHSLNPQAKLQMAKLFYEDLGQPPIHLKAKRGVPGGITCGKEALVEIAKREPILRGLVKAIAEHRSLGVFLATFVNAPLDTDGRMRTSYNICGTETFRFSSSKNAFGSGCFPPGAEVLTPAGWRALETVVNGQAVAQFDPSTKQLSWAPAVPFSTDFSGKLCWAKTEQFSTAVTPGHRILATKAGREDWQAYPAGVLSGYSSQFKIPASGSLQGGTIRFSAERLLVAALADGSYDDTRVRFAFKKTRKCERLIALCQEYDIELNETSCGREGYRRFWFRLPTDWPVEKKWGWWALDLAGVAASAMLDECRYWDAHERGESFIFYSADKEQAEIVQTLAHISGHSATLRVDEQNEGSYSTTTMHCVNVKPRDEVGVFGKHWTTSPYVGKVYCITVPTSYFLVRQFGYISVTGNTNLQNVPKGDEGSEDDDEEVSLLGRLHLPNVRKIFVPDPGFEIFDKDLSKADLRIVTWEADEPEMKAMLKEGRDPYVEIAREFYGDPTIKKTREDGSENPKYRTFKSFAHGTHYLGTPYGLAGRLGLTVHQAEKTQKWYLGRMKRIAEWQREFCSALRSRRYAENIFGYRRYYFGQVTDQTCREAIAWVPQSTVALYINRIWMNIYERYPHIWILLQVHDSLVGQYPRHRREESLRHLDEASQIVLPYDDPLIIPSGTKTSTVSWGAC